MKILKPSKYNLLTEDFNGDLLIANLLTTNFIKIEKSRKTEVSELLKRSRIDENGIAIYRDLLNKGFIVDFDLDEKELADFKYYEKAYSNEELELVIIPTDKCNFKCIYCYQEDNEYHQMPLEIEDRIIKFIKRNGSKFKKVLISWFGGEPLLMKDRVVAFMEKINKTCMELKVPVVGRMSTNGYLLDVETFKKFIQNKLIHFQITIDGDRETHNKMRPHKTNSDSYDVVLNNLKAIHEQVRNHYRIALRINIVHSMLDIMDTFLNEIKVFERSEKIRIHWQVTTDYGGNQVKKLDKELLNKTELFSMFIDKATEMGINSMAYNFFQYATGLCEANKMHSYYIDYKANLHKCSLAMYDENYKCLNNIGYIDETGNAIINEGRQSQWLIRKELKKECLSCVYYPLCYGCTCPFTRKIKNTDLCLYVKDQLIFFMRNMSKRGTFENLKIEEKL